MMKFIMDLSNQVWLFSGEPTEPNAFAVEFYIDMVPGQTPFKNFDFDFMLKGKNDLEAVIETETEEEIVERSRQQEEETVFPYLCNVHYFSNLMAGETYTLDVSFKNRRKFVYDSYSFTMPKPLKPHEDWVWDSNSCSWVPPIPMPSPVWDQELQKWIIP